MRVLCADCGHREAMPKHVAKLALETKQDPKCPRCKSANLTVDATATKRVGKLRLANRRGSLVIVGSDGRVLDTVNIPDQNTGRMVPWRVVDVKVLTPSANYPWTHQLMLMRPTGKTIYVMDGVFIEDVLVQQSGLRRYPGQWEPDGNTQLNPRGASAHVRTANSERNEMARNLKPGDLVDVANLYHYWDAEPYGDDLSNYEYGVVDEVVDNGDGEVTIYFENMDPWVLPYDANAIVATGARRRYASDPKDPEMVYGPESGYWEAEDEMYREQYENQNLRMLSDEEADEFDRGWEQHRQERDAYDEYVQDFMGKSPEDLGRSARRRNVRGRRVARRVAMRRQAYGGTPQVWIASLSDYNNGDLIGKWVDATSLASLEQGAEEVLAMSRQPGAEELAIHDYDNFGDFGSILGEYPNYDDVVAVAQMIEEYGPIAFAAGKIASSIDDIANLIDEYQGEFRTDVEFAQELVDEIGLENIGNPEYYFDYARWGRDVATEWSWSEDDDEPDPSLEALRNDYNGDHGAWAEQLVDDMGGVGELDSSTLEAYFDWESFARDLMMDYYEADGHYFRAT
jgi:antirestriction protein